MPLKKPMRVSRAKKAGYKIIKWLLSIFIPVANPDFEEKIDEVTVWLLQCDSEGIPEREIGLNSNNEVVAKMPFGKNYGYWTDNMLTLDDFKSRFEFETITSEYFEQQWNSLTTG